VIDAYLAHRRGRVAREDFSADALANAERILLNFSVHFGSKVLSQCRRHDATEWLDSNPQWKSGDSTNKALHTLRACFCWAEEEDLISANPYKSFRRLMRRRGHRRPASVAEYVTLMRHGSRALRRAVFFIRRAGCRTCEMREARWADVHFDLGVIALYKHKTARATGKPRLIGLDPSLLRFLRNLHR
jgi:integrase